MGEADRRTGVGISYELVDRFHSNQRRTRALSWFPNRGSEYWL
ncbi:MAG TPA: hypothetical protein VIT64_13980 [Ilumatobacteraceae bacterium]